MRRAKIKGKDPRIVYDSELKPYISINKLKPLQENLAGYLNVYDSKCLPAIDFACIGPDKSYMDQPNLYLVDKVILYWESGPTKIKKELNSKTTILLTHGSNQNGVWSQTFSPNRPIEQILNDAEQNGHYVDIVDACNRKGEVLPNYHGKVIYATNIIEGSFIVNNGKFEMYLSTPGKFNLKSS